MKYLYHILIFIALVSCHRTNNSMFRWSPLVPEADSVTLSLERELIKSTDLTSLRPLIEKMDSISENYPDIKQLQGRTYYWRAKMYHKLEMFDSMEYWSGKARLLIDSVAYPYDYARLNLLFCTRISERTLNEFIRISDVIDYARKTSDHFLEANALLALDLLKAMLKIKSNDNELKQTTELYSDLGLIPYTLRIKANIALRHLSKGDSVTAYEILKELLEDRKLKEDKYFYTKVLFDIGLTKNSPEYMAMASEKAKDHNKVLEMTCRWYEGHFSKLNGNHYRADSIYKSLLPLVDNCSHELKSYIFYDNALRLEREGKSDSALIMLKMYMAEQDTLNFTARRDEMIRIDTANKLRQYEERASRDRKEERLKWSVAVLAILVVGLTGYILLSSRLRKERIRKQEVETELDSKNTLLESEQRALMSQGLAMTEKDNVLQSVSDHVSRLEKEGTLTYGEARKLDADIRLHLNGRQEWDDFKELFSKVHPAFADEVMKRYPKITEGDLRLAVYIKAGLSTKQIARMLMVQPASVKMNRHRLRERMGLTSDQSLEDAIREV